MRYTIRMKYVGGGADLRVATLIGRRAEALAALNTARAAVKVTGNTLAGSGRVVAWSAKHHGSILTIDEARFEGGVGKSLSATGGSLRLKVRCMEERTFSCCAARSRTSAGESTNGSGWRSNGRLACRAASV